MRWAAQSHPRDKEPTHRLQWDTQLLQSSGRLPRSGVNGQQGTSRQRPCLPPPPTSLGPSPAKLLRQDRGARDWTTARWHWQRCQAQPGTRESSAVDAEPEGEEVYGEERDPGMCKHTCLGKEDTLPHLVSDSPVTLRNRFWAQFSQGPHMVTQSHSLSLGTLKSEEQGCRVDR